MNDGKRFWLLAILLFLATGAVGTRLVMLHLNLVSSKSTPIRYPRYAFSRDLPALRGSIFPANGETFPVARSVPVWEYHVDPQGVNIKRHSRESVISNVAEALSLPIDKVRVAYWNTSSRYVPLAESFDNEAYAILSNHRKVSGLAIDEKHVRKYPQGRRLSHVLGFMSKDPENRVGVAGIELKYEKMLAGKPGKVEGERDARGNEIYNRRKISVQPEAGADVYLTIDQNIQYYVETELAAGMTKNQATAGWSVVMDVKTGAILAMATCPDYSPTEFNKVDAVIKRNRVIAENYEPGSVMKTITACAIINENLVKPETLIDTKQFDPRYRDIPGDHGHSWPPFMSVRDALAHSSNIVYGKLGYDLGPIKLYAYFEAFGFGRKTGIDLPGEEMGILPDPKKKMWDKASWSRAAIGQFVAVTPIQMAAAYSAVANGGILLQPYVVSKVVSQSGEILFRNTRREIRRVVKPETAAQVREMMLGVAKKGGTARRAAVKGYTVAGKTGTAQMREGKGYSNTRYNSSFIGIIPASDPQVVIVVTYQEPAYCRSYKYSQESGLPLYNHQGGVCAAPVFSRIATEVMRYLEVKPDNPDELTMIE